MSFRKNLVILEKNLVILEKNLVILESNFILSGAKLYVFGDKLHPLGKKLYPLGKKLHLLRIFKDYSVKYQQKLNKFKIILENTEQPQTFRQNAQSTPLTFHILKNAVTKKLFRNK
jgi:hypothetical protein